MNIKIWIDKSVATIAIQFELKYGENVTSRKKFYKAVTHYIAGYGEQCIDDHNTELEEFKEKAEVIVEKYYRH